MFNKGEFHCFTTNCNHFLSLSFTKVSLSASAKHTRTSFTENFFTEAGWLGLSFLLEVRVRENPQSLPKDTPQASYRHQTPLTTCGLSSSDNERDPSMFQSTESASKRPLNQLAVIARTAQGLKSAKLAEGGQPWGREDWQLQSSRGDRGAVSPWSSNLPPGGRWGGDLSWVESSACLSRASHCFCYIAVILTH
ncbi:hypothetical protein Q7C36_008961 [Tachysurus vachellii]|uniref:Uncharacterized protein n=1 Tax=Tachysurus vachellii TaxID=175792 RepID=A0AA88N3E9_TACVA|nr:hypothetical protein Q7C36_008961 [Tachysurus vachellii]